MLTAHAAIDGPLDGQRIEPVSIERRAVSQWHAEYICSLPPVAGHEDLDSLEFTIACDEVWALTHERELRPVRGTFEPPFPVGKFVALRRGSDLVRLEIPFASRFTIERTREGVRLKARIADRSACGLAMWRTLDCEVPSSVCLFEDKLDGIDECPWIEPYPERARAVICLTDHPDFDTAPKLAQLTSLFVRAGIRFTKGVFPRSEPSGHKNEPGLDHNDYLDSVRTLHADGTEIAFHGLGPRVDAPALDECKRRCDVMAKFAPQTWIDHGTGRYLFTRDNVLGGRPLQEFLRPLGVRNYWSYIDLWDNPMRELSCWDGRTSGSIPAELARTMLRLRRQPRAKQLGKAQLYPAMHALNNLVGVQATNLLRTRRWDRSTPGVLRRFRRELVRLQHHPFVMYSETGGGYALDRSDDWIFDTVLLNHPAVQLTPESIEDLISRSGLLVAHVYLCAQHSYLRGGCFISGTEATLNPSFIEVIDQLAAAQRRGAVISLSFARLRQTLEAHRATRIERTLEGWRVVRVREAPRLAVGGTAHFFDVAQGGG